MKLKSLITEAPLVKSKQMEDMRYIAQSLSAVLEELMTVQGTLPPDSAVKQYVDTTITHVQQAKKVFASGLKSSL
jgi:hypothetical protein